nr:hypothetical protein [Tanacetum cinerariifolium]
MAEGSEKAAEGSARAEEGSSKRAAGKLEQEDAKRQRIKEENESVELKKCSKIIPDDDDDVTIEATPLSFKSPTIVDYKIYREGMNSFFKIIRADGLLISVLLFIVCEEVIKVESCPSEIIFDDILALDLIVCFNLGDWRLKQTATFSILTNSKRKCGLINYKSLLESISAPPQIMRGKSVISISDATTNKALQIVKDPPSLQPLLNGEHERLAPIHILPGLKPLI